MPNLNEITEDAMKLGIDDRAALAEALLASLNDLTKEEAERVWAEEAQRRLADFHEGRAKAIPADEVHKKAEQLYR